MLINLLLTKDEKTIDRLILEFNTSDTA
jgi:hypothetical protein